jgi:hypothetical protein
MQRWFFVCALALPITGCCGPVKEAVKAYGVAIDGVAEVGAVLAAECGDLGLETTKHAASCKQLKDTFSTIKASADELKKIQ